MTALNYYDPRLAGGDIDQSIFPGAYIEPKWMRPDLLRESPYYAARILLGCVITKNPNDKTDYVSLLLDGQEYILHIDNYKACSEAAQACFFDFLKANSFDQNIIAKLHSHPNLLLDCVKWMQRRINNEYNVPEHKARIFFISGDFGACSALRSDYPYEYFNNENCEVRDNFFIQRSSIISLGALNFFDAVLVHRCPSTPMMKILRAFKRGGKTIIYETDDDMFKVPDYNINSSMIKPEDLERIRETISMSDVILTTNDYLSNELGYKEKTKVVPNLLRVEKYKVIKKTALLDKKIAGFLPQRNNGKVEFVNRATKVRKSLESFNISDPEVYNPVKIMWMGSNTHDGDLQHIVETVKILGAKYGMAIRFIFFGYAPLEFLTSIAERGNIAQGFRVKEEYVGFVELIPGVQYNSYFNTFNQIHADIGICPLDEHEFNLSKSNIKPLEFGARGIPSVVTNYGPYTFIEDRVNGIKVNNTTEEWVKALSELIENDTLRTRIGSRIYNDVHLHYSWNTKSDNRDKWDSAFLHVKEVIDDSKKGRQESFTHTLTISD